MRGILQHRKTHVSGELLLHVFIKRYDRRITLIVNGSEEKKIIDTKVEFIKRVTELSYVNLRQRPQQSPGPGITMPPLVKEDSS